MQQKKWLLSPFVSYYPASTYFLHIIHILSGISYFFIKPYQKRTSDIYRGNMDIIIKKNIYTFQDITSSQLANRRKSSAEIQSRLKYIMDAVYQQSRRISFRFLILSISIISLPHTLSALLSLKCLHIYLICLTSLRDSGTFEIKSRSALYKLQSYPCAHFI